MILLGGILATVGMIGGAYLAIFLQERKESRLEQARNDASGSEITMPDLCRGDGTNGGLA